MPCVKSVTEQPRMAPHPDPAHRHLPMLPWLPDRCRAVAPIGSIGGRCARPLDNTARVVYHGWHLVNRLRNRLDEFAVATMRDVAKLAGVSTATVSHVLNSTRRVEPDTSERVRAAIEKLGYEVDGVAQ